MFKRYISLKKMQSLFLFLIDVGCVFGGVIIAPSNTAVKAGEMVKLQCYTDGEYRVRKWTVFNSEHQTTTIYTHPDIIDKKFKHFGVEVDENGSGFLYTNSTRVEDAGNYTCVTRDGEKDVKSSAQLTVFEADPICHSNLKVGRNESFGLSDGDLIWMRCAFAFRGFWTPTVEWNENDVNGKKRIIMEGVDTFQASSGYSITSSLSFTVNASMNGSIFSCRIFFSNITGIIRHMTATNVPNFTYTWSSTIISLPYSTVSPTTAELTSSFPDLSTFTLTTGVNETPTSDSYFILFTLVTVLSLLLIVVVIVSIAFCVYYKRRISEQKTGKVKEGSGERAASGVYEFMPYAVTDAYDRIEESEIKDDIGPPQIPSLPTHEYSGLSPTNPNPPAVYTRMEHHERPRAEEDSFESGNSGSAKEVNPVKSYSERQNNEDGKPNAAGSQPHSYLELREGGNEITDHKVTSDAQKYSNSSSMYVSDANYEKSLPKNQSNVSPTETSENAYLIATGDQ